MGLITRPRHTRIIVTPEGSDYLVERGIIEE